MVRWPPRAVQAQDRLGDNQGGWQEPTSLESAEVKPLHARGHAEDTGTTPDDTHIWLLRPPRPSRNRYICLLSGE